MTSGIPAPTAQIEQLAWFKASASSNSTGCVEAAWLADGRIAVRDSKDRAKPAHTFTRVGWSTFLTAAKHGEFDS